MGRKHPWGALFETQHKLLHSPSSVYSSNARHCNACSYGLAKGLWNGLEQPRGESTTCSSSSSSSLLIYTYTRWKTMQSAIDSIKTTSMGNVSTGVLDKNKEHYSRSKDKAEKSYDVFRHMQLYMSKYKKWRFTFHYVKYTAQRSFKSRFPKSGPTYRRQVVNPRHQTPQG